MKKITQQQLDAIKQLLVKYNIDVQEYSAVEKMFNELPAELPANEVQEESK